jgi:parallel beta-helix repeat protein
MRYKNKSTSLRVVLRLVVGLATSLFVLSLTNALNAEDVTSHQERFWNAEPVECGDELVNGYYKLAEDLQCYGDEDNPAIAITGPAKLNLNGYTLSGKKDIDDNIPVCIQIEGDGARVWNGFVTNCLDGILIDKGASNIIIKVEAYKNYERGFKIKKGDENLLFNCSARKNGRQGFIITKGDENWISHSKAIANCRDGIEIEKGNENHIRHNLVMDNGNEDTCIDFVENYKPWYYAGIDVLSGSENNEIKFNRAGCNLGCVGSDDFPCAAHERDFWDENVDIDEKGQVICVSTNMWDNNSIKCNNVEQECSPNPDPDD